MRAFFGSFEDVCLPPLLYTLLPGFGRLLYMLGSRGGCIKLLYMIPSRFRDCPT